MAIFRERLPSSDEIGLAFAACVFPIHVWTVINVLREVPAWVLRLTAWELVGVISYTLMVALLESLLLLAGLVVLGALLPRSWLGGRYVAQASLAVFITAAWAVAGHYNMEAVRLWGAKQMGPWLLIYLASIGVGYALVRWLGWLERGVRSIVERLSILSFVYVFVDVLAVIVVVIRNV